MAIKITIGGTDYTQYVDMTKLKIESNIAVNSDNAELNIIIPNKALPRPKGGQEIIISNGSSIEFAGVVVLPHEEALTPTTMNYDTKARDYVYWFDKRVVTEQYTNMSAGNIVLNIVQNWAPNFTTHNVQGTDSSFNIPYIKFDHLNPSQCLQKLADAVGYNWWIDYHKDVHFAPQNTTTSPLPNNQLLADTDTANYGDLYIEEDVSQVRNQVFVTGHKIAANYFITEKHATDGNQTSFNLNYEPQGDVTQMTIKAPNSTTATTQVTYTPKNDLTDGQATNTTYDGKAYVHQKNQTVRFNVAPASGVLTVTYKPRYEMVNLYNDPNAMAVMKQRDLQDGVYEFVIRDRQLSGDDTTLADTRGRIELAKYAYPHLSGEFTSYLQGWKTGQYFLFTSNNRMDGTLQNFEFYVVKVQKVIKNHPIYATPQNWNINYANKVAGSTSANGNISYYGRASSLITPSGSWTAELSQSYYNQIQTLDNNSLQVGSTATSGYMAQELFQFDIIRALTDKFGSGVWQGYTALSDKINLALQYINYLQLNWTGYGTSPNGNKATVGVYDAVGTVGYDSYILSNTASSPSTVNYNITSSWTNKVIDSNGMVNFIAYTNASDGVTQSVLFTDYVELQIKTNQILGSPTIFYTIDFSDSPYVY